MRIGFNLPISGPLLSPDAVVQIAQAGEALGYDYLTLTDHIVLPNLQVPGYPYSESGEFLAEGPEHRHEQLATAAYIAAKTSRIGLVLAVMVVPHRPAVSPPRCWRRSMYSRADGLLSASARAGFRRSSTRSWGRRLPRGVL
jgi:hypothetical protein